MRKILSVDETPAKNTWIQNQLQSSSSTPLPYPFLLKMFCRRPHIPYVGHKNALNLIYSYRITYLKKVIVILCRLALGGQTVKNVRRLAYFLLTVR